MKDYQELPVFPHLLDLLHETRRIGIQPILIGGLGLYLKREEILRLGSPTAREILPDARATSDIDALIQIIDLGDDAKRTALHHVICETLGYTPVHEARYFKFKKQVLHTMGGEPFDVKIDLHAREPELGESARSKPSDTRVPSGSKTVQGRKTREAFAAEVKPWAVTVDGRRSDGQACTVAVLLPHPFAFLMMKLEAARDHHDKQGQSRDGRGSKHAFDVYLILSMMTESEWGEAREFARRDYAGHEMVERLKQVTPLLYGTDEAPCCQDVLVTHRDNGGRYEEIDLTWMRGVLYELWG